MIMAAEAEIWASSLDTIVSITRHEYSLTFLDGRTARVLCLLSSYDGNLRRYCNE